MAPCDPPKQRRLLPLAAAAAAAVVLAALAPSPAAAWGACPAAVVPPPPPQQQQEGALLASLAALPSGGGSSGLVGLSVRIADSSSSSGGAAAVPPPGAAARVRFATDNSPGAPAVAVRLARLGLAGSAANATAAAAGLNATVAVLVGDALEVVVDLGGAAPPLPPSPPPPPSSSSSSASPSPPPSAVVSAASRGGGGASVVAAAAAASGVVAAVAGGGQTPAAGSGAVAAAAVVTMALSTAVSAADVQAGAEFGDPLLTFRRQSSTAASTCVGGATLELELVVVLSSTVLLQTTPGWCPTASYEGGRLPGPELVDAGMLGSALAADTTAVLVVGDVRVHDRAGVPRGAMEAVEMTIPVARGLVDPVNDALILVNGNESGPDPSASARAMDASFVPVALWDDGSVRTLLARWRVDIAAAQGEQSVSLFRVLGAAAGGPVAGTPAAACAATLAPAPVLRAPTLAGNGGVSARVCLEAASADGCVDVDLSRPGYSGELRESSAPVGTTAAPYNDAVDRVFEVDVEPMTDAVTLVRVTARQVEGDGDMWHALQLRLPDVGGAGVAIPAAPGMTLAPQWTGNATACHGDTCVALRDGIWRGMAPGDGLAPFIAASAHTPPRAELVFPLPIAPSARARYAAGGNGSQPVDRQFRVVHELFVHRGDGTAAPATTGDAAALGADLAARVDSPLRLTFPDGYVAATGAYGPMSLPADIAAGSGLNYGLLLSALQSGDATRLITRGGYGILDIALGPRAYGDDTMNENSAYAGFAAQEYDAGLAIGLAALTLSRSVPTSVTGVDPLDTLDTSIIMAHQYVGAVMAENGGVYQHRTSYFAWVNHLLHDPAATHLISQWRAPTAPPLTYTEIDTFIRTQLADTDMADTIATLFNASGQPAEPWLQERFTTPERAERALARIIAWFRRELAFLKLEAEATAGNVTVPTDPNEIIFFLIDFQFNDTGFQELLRSPPGPTQGGQLPAPPLSVVAAPALARYGGELGDGPGRVCCKGAQALTRLPMLHNADIPIGSLTHRGGHTLVENVVQAWMLTGAAHLRRGARNIAGYIVNTMAPEWLNRSPPSPSGGPDQFTREYAWPAVGLLALEVLVAGDASDPLAAQVEATLDGYVSYLLQVPQNRIQGAIHFGITIEALSRYHATAPPGGSRTVAGVDTYLVEQLGNRWAQEQFDTTVGMLNYNAGDPAGNAGFSGLRTMNALGAYGLAYTANLASTASPPHPNATQIGNVACAVWNAIADDLATRPNPVGGHKPVGQIFRSTPRAFPYTGAC